MLLLHPKIVRLLILSVIRDIRKDLAVALIEVKKRELFLEILKTPPSNFSYLRSSEQIIEVTSLTSKNDYLMLILAIKTLKRHMKIPFKVLIIDDGTLEAEHVEKLQTHLLGAKIISKEVLDCKIEAKWSKRSVFYRLKSNPYIRKKLGAILFCSSEKVLFVDSDILFFKKPNALQKWFHGEYDIVFNQDIEDSYFLSYIESKVVFKVGLFPRVNSGLLGIPYALLDWKILMKLCELYETGLSVGRGPQIQTYFAILLEKNKNSKKILNLPKSYLESDTISDYESELVCGHYVRAVREKYFSIDAKRAISILYNSSSM